MQNDAIKRAEDMRRQARTSAGLEGSSKLPLQDGTSQKQEPRHVPMPKGYLGNKDAPRPDKIQPPTDNILSRIGESFGNINIDSDKALLLSLIMLLSEENADELLIMALIYMLT